MNSDKQIKIGAILTYLQMAVAIAISLIYTPLMIRVLGKSEYGLYNTIASTISLLSLLSLGFNSSYVKFFSKYKQDNEVDKIFKLNGLFLIVFCIIGIVAFLCGLFLTINLELVFKNGLIESEYKTAKVLMLLLTINLTISFPMSVFTNIISAHEKFIFQKLLLIFKTVGTPAISIPLLLLGKGSISIVIATLIISLFVDLVSLLYVLAILKQKFVFRSFEKGIFKDLLVFTSFIAINMVVDQINLNIDKILLGRFKGTEIVAVYSVGYTLYTYFQMFSTSVSSLFTPKVHKIVLETEGDEIEQKKQLTNLFVKIARIQFMILGLICTGFVFFAKQFIVQFWAGSGYDDAYYVLLLLAIPSMIPLTQNIGIEVQRAKNKHKFRSIVYLIMALVNLIVSIFLCQMYGAVGCAIGTAISLLLANGLIMNIYYSKQCNINVSLYWLNILKMCLGLIIPIIIGVISIMFINYKTIWEFLIGVLAYSIIYFISMFVLGMNKEEKSFLLDPIKKLLKKE